VPHIEYEKEFMAQTVSAT